MRLTAVILLALAGATAAHGQALRGGSPLDISANANEILAANCTVVYSGDVQIARERTRMHARKITGYQAREGRGCSDVWERLEAEGEVHFVTPDQNIRADRAVYAFKAETITFTGGVVVRAGQNVQQGERLIIQLKDGAAQTATMAAQPGGRVRGVFYPGAAEPTRP